MIDDKTSGEWRTYLPEIMLLKAELLIEMNEIPSAIAILRQQEGKLRKRVANMKKKVSYLLESSQAFIEKSDREWLKI